MTYRRHTLKHNRKTLISPHTIIRADTIMPSFYENDVTIASQRTRRHSGSSSLSDSQLVHEETFGVDLQNRQYMWYVLKDLENKASFELRISYPATVSRLEIPPVFTTMYLLKKNVEYQPLKSSCYFLMNSLPLTLTCRFGHWKRLRSGCPQALIFLITFPRYARLELLAFAWEEELFQCHAKETSLFG